jgi:hypothetical protein
MKGANHESQRNIQIDYRFCISNEALEEGFSGLNGNQI